MSNADRTSRPTNTGGAKTDAVNATFLIIEAVREGALTRNAGAHLLGAIFERPMEFGAEIIEPALHGCVSDELLRRQEQNRNMLERSMESLVRVSREHADQLKHLADGGIISFDEIKRLAREAEEIAFTLRVNAASVRADLRELRFALAREAQAKQQTCGSLLPSPPP